MRIVVLGSAAGGGLPQWNCNCTNCRLVRQGAASIKPRTQSSLAISRDGKQWFLLNCSPDIRQQLNENRCLWPHDGQRASPLAGVIVTNGDVDHVAGLLGLRENSAFTLHASRSILSNLADNRIMNVLNPDKVQRVPLEPGQRVEIASVSGPVGIHVESFTVPGKTALYLEGETVQTDVEGDETIGLEIEADGRSFFYVPGCARVTPGLQRRLQGAALLFFDGTLWRDDEMIRQGLGEKTGRRMGHISMSGDDGSLAALREVDIRRHIYIHINNTNPVLREDSAEHATVREAGWEIAFDGMELTL